MTTEPTQLRYEVADRVATVTLCRPEKLNAFTPTMAAELAEVAAEADADDGVRVVVVTGAGRAFCAGADLSGGRETFRDRGTVSPGQGTIDGVPRDWGGIASLPFAALRKPVIAAVNGPAVGIGATLTLPMDIRIAAESARFGFVFGRVGIVPEAASSWFLPRVVGISQAMEWVATGRVFDAAEALRGRLVSRVVPDADLLPTAYALAAEIAANTSGGRRRGGPPAALVDARRGLAVGRAPGRVAGTGRAGRWARRGRGRGRLPREAARRLPGPAGRRRGRRTSRAGRSPRTTSSEWSRTARKMLPSDSTHVPEPGRIRPDS